MSRALRHLVLCFILLAAQQAAQAHAFTHLRQAPKGDPDKSVPASHPAAQCLVFHAMDSVLPSGNLELEPLRITPDAPLSIALFLPIPARIQFDSRAPPLAS